jgi:hypothetical protein
MRPLVKAAAIFVFGGLLGGVAGFAVGIFVYPYIFLADIVATERVENPSGRPAIAKGTFIHANPSDHIHHGKGGVTIYDGVLHLESDFEVGPGPKFHVYLVPERKITTSTNVARLMFLDLGRLKAFKGSQNYVVPAGTDISKYGSVVIWCEQFGVLISPAELSHPAAARSP